jgi:hypothetical protein
MPICCEWFVVCHLCHNGLHTCTVVGASGWRLTVKKHSTRSSTDSLSYIRSSVAYTVYCHSYPVELQGNCRTSWLQNLHEVWTTRIQRLFSESSPYNKTIANNLLDSFFEFRKRVLSVSCCKKCSWTCTVTQRDAVTTYGEGKLEFVWPRKYSWSSATYRLALHLEEEPSSAHWID